VFLDRWQRDKKFGPGCTTVCTQCSHRKL